MRTKSLAMCASLTLLSLCSLDAHAQSFGAAKEKVVLQRKLPALAHLSGSTIKVKVTAHKEDAQLAPDLEALLETELLKNDPHLTTTEINPSSIILCEITDYSHPRPIVTTQPGIALGKKTTKPQTNTRITGSLSVSFQAKTGGGQTLISDNVTSKYDETFDGSGNDISHGIMNSMTGGWKRMTGSGGNEQLSPPTDAELRSRLVNDVVRQIASHVVNTSETLEVFLAKQKGPIEDGDKEATAGLWQRALETYETAPQLPKPEDDAYRLYNIGVAYEALAYKAEDQKSAMKFLDEAAINYGKAIDAKPAEKYFLEPQKRIETAIVHYKRLEDEENEKARAAAQEKARKQEEALAATKPESPAVTPGAISVAKPSDPKALTNEKVIAMVKAGLDDDTVAQTIRTAKLARFDLTTSGLQALSTNGVSDQILKAMKARAARKTVAAK
jgi:tetratricopeptide (TPR) repeat protein